MRQASVIPAGWEARHIPVATATMTAECEIREPDIEDPGGYNSTTNRTPMIPGPLKFTRECRVQRINRELVRPDGEQQVTTSDYLVAVPFDVTGVEVDDRVSFITISDADLVGHRLTVTGVLKGSMRWQRDLMCVDDLG